MLIQHIALVAEEQAVGPSELARVSAALQTQVTRDLSPIWGQTATVCAFPRLEDLPPGFWPIVVSREPLDGEAGLHVDRDGHPYARVEASLLWSLDASRACLELLVNPFAQRTATAASPRSDQGAVEYIVEVSAPCADAANGYCVNDVLVSDFCTPAYFGDGPAAARRFSFRGSLDAPQRLLPGGHLTWYEPVTGSVWMRNHYGDNPLDTRLGAPGTRPVRTLLRERAPHRPQSRRLPLALAVQLRTSREQMLLASGLRAERLRTLLDTPLLPAATDAVLVGPGEVDELRIDLDLDLDARIQPARTTTLRSGPREPEVRPAPLASPQEPPVRQALAAADASDPALDATSPSMPAAKAQEPAPRAPEAIAPAQAMAPSSTPSRKPPPLRPSSSTRPPASLPPTLADTDEGTLRPVSLAPQGVPADANRTRAGKVALLAAAVLCGGLLALLVTTPERPRRAGAAQPARSQATAPELAAPAPVSVPASSLSSSPAVPSLPSAAAANAAAPAPVAARALPPAAAPAPAKPSAKVARRRSRASSSAPTVAPPAPTPAAPPPALAVVPRDAAAAQRAVSALDGLLDTRK